MPCLKNCLLLLVASFVAACGARSALETRDQNEQDDPDPSPTGCVDNGGRCRSADLVCPAEEQWGDPRQYACAEGEFYACCLPRNQTGRCAEPELVVLSDGGIFIDGDTSNLIDEFSGIDCGSTMAASGFDQGQAYYVFTAVAGANYAFQLAPSFYGFMYIFPRSTSCSETAIQAACSSDGENGDVSPIVNPNTNGSLSFTATETAEYIVVVDSDTSTGRFTLAISKNQP